MPGEVDPNLIASLSSRLEEAERARDEAITTVVKWVAAGWQERADRAESALAAAQVKIGRYTEVLRPFADAVDQVLANADQIGCKPGRTALRIPYAFCEAVSAALKEGT